MERRIRGIQKSLLIGMLIGILVLLFPTTTFAERANEGGNQVSTPIPPIYGTKVLAIKPSAPQLKMIEIGRASCRERV